jgi:hypothetical protein
MEIYNEDENTIFCSDCGWSYYKERRFMSCPICECNKQIEELKDKRTKLIEEVDCNN